MNVRFAVFLGASTSLVLALFSLVPGFLEPYLAEIGRSSTSKRELLVYCVSLVAWALVSELLLRGLVQRRRGPLFVALATVLYALPHIRYGASQAAYALVLGILLATLYDAHARRSTLPVMLGWRATWDVGALALALFFATAQVEPFFSPIAREHKRAQLDEGRLFAHPEWGVLDAAHMEASLHRKKDALDALARGERVVRGEVAFAGAFSSLVEKVDMRFVGQVDNAEDVACAYAYALAVVEEEMQSRAPILSGGRMSAYSPEDIQTAAAVCFVDDRRVDAVIDVTPRAAPRVPARHRARWAEIEALVQRWRVGSAAAP